MGESSRANNVATMSRINGVDGEQPVLIMLKGRATMTLSGVFPQSRWFGEHLTKKACKKLEEELGGRKKRRKVYKCMMLQAHTGG